MEQQRLAAPDQAVHVVSCSRTPGQHPLGIRTCHRTCTSFLSLWSFTAPLACVASPGVSFVRAPGTGGLPRYKPANGVLTAATLLQCRRAETNRIQYHGIWGAAHPPSARRCHASHSLCTEVFIKAWKNPKSYGRDGGSQMLATSIDSNGE